MVLISSSEECCEMSWTSPVSMAAKVQPEHILKLHTGQEYQVEDPALVVPAQTTLEEQMMRTPLLLLWNFFRL